MRTWLVYPLMLVLLSGCLTDGEVVGSGKVAVREYPAVPFVNVVMNTAFGRLYVEQGDKSSFRVEADDNLVDLFATDVQDKTLTISLKEPKKISTNRAIKFYATMPKIESVTVNGSGTVQSHGTLKTDQLHVKISGSGFVTLDIKGKNLDVNISGSGDANIKGEIDKQTINISGSGSYHGQDLLANDTKLTVSGSGDALVNVKDNLNVGVYGSGSVRYKGHPKVVQTIEGSGGVQALD